MSNWVGTAAEQWCVPIVEKMHELMLAWRSIHADKTTVQVLYPQSEDFYNNKMLEYGNQRFDGEKVLKTLQCKKAARLSRKELLEGLIREMQENEMTAGVFDEKLWRLMVEKVVVGTEGREADIHMLTIFFILIHFLESLRFGAPLVL